MPFIATRSGLTVKRSLGGVITD